MDRTKQNVIDMFAYMIAYGLSHDGEHKRTFLIDNVLTTICIQGDDVSVEQYGWTFKPSHKITKAYEVSFMEDSYAGRMMRETLHFAWHNIKEWLHEDETHDERIKRLIEEFGAW